MEQEKALNQNDLEKLLSKLPHKVISTTRFTEKELREKIEEKTPVRSRYSVGEFYIPSELFTIKIDYPIPELKERETRGATIKYVGQSDLKLNGLLIAKYDEHGRLTIEGYAHPERELERFKATGNVESATIVRIPEIFNSIPELIEMIEIYPIDKKEETESVSLAQLALSRINPHIYHPTSLLLTGMDTALKPYILSLEGDCGKPVYDGTLGLTFSD